MTTPTAVTPITGQLAAPPQRSFVPYVVFLILIAATIPWRRNTYFAGGLDSVVLTKAVLSVVALGLAVAATAGRPTRALPAAPLMFLVLYLTCTVVGAGGAGDPVPSTIIAIRVLVLAVTVTVLSRAFDGVLMVGSLIVALATFAICGVVTGLGDVAAGRLSGGVPPLHPNELASTCAVVVLWCLWRMSAGQDTLAHLLSVAVAFAILVATGSRTPLVALAVASLFLVFNARALRVRTLIIILTAAPVMLWLLTGTNFATELILRGEDSSRLGTLNSRTIAWQAALAPKESAWLTWFGGGLELKRLQVEGQYWEQQILDSSWVSALVQSGFVGLALCAAWVLFSIFGRARARGELGVLQLALVTYLALRAFLESGLFDASTSFLVFFTTAMAGPIRVAVASTQFDDSVSPDQPATGRRGPAWLGD